MQFIDLAAQQALIKDEIDEGIANPFFQTQGGNQGAIVKTTTAGTLCGRRRASRSTHAPES